MPRAAIIDIDGTLANLMHRVHYVRGSNSDYDAFYAAMLDDKPYPVVINVIASVMRAHLDTLGEEVTFFICTGRSEKYRSDTLTWLTKECRGILSGVFSGEGALLMRADDDDNRSDVEVKRDMLKNIRAQGYDVEFCFDDRDSVVKMWREEGITCFQTAPGDWEDKPAVTAGTLHMMVGPCAAGKTTFVEDMTIETIGSTSAIVSSDALRVELNDGDIRNQSKNPQVYHALRAIVEARLAHGLDTVVDATNIHNRDRTSLRAITPRTSRIVYHIIDRTLEEKLRDARWRKGVQIKGKSLVEFTHNVFYENLKDILAGDGDQRVDVIDHRQENLK